MPGAPCRLLIFDLDGVLIDSGADIAEALSETLHRRHIAPPDQAEILRHVGNGALDLVRGVCPGRAEDELREILTEYKAYYLAHPVVHTRLMPDVRETLEFARARGVHRAVVTNKMDDVTHRIL